jgi:iron complex outermembrane receptor protein
LHFSAGNAHASNAIEDTPDSTPVDTSATTATTLDSVPVIGAGEPHQVQCISEVDKQVLPPGTRGQKILKRLPGVSVQANNAFGATEESQTISVAASTSAGWATRWTASRRATPALASTTA